MFRLVVLFTFVALATAAPGGYLQTIPVATSHQKRVDIIESSPILKEVITPVHFIADHSEDDVHDIHDFQNIFEEADTIVVPSSEIVKTVTSHQEVHQVHDTPVQHLESSHQEIPVVIVEEDIHHPEEFAENVHQVHDSPVYTVESDASHEIPIVFAEDVHDSLVEEPQVYQIIESNHEPVLHSVIPVSHEVVPQVHELPVLSVVKTVPTAVSHSSRTDVHESSVVLPEVHVW